MSDRTDILNAINDRLMNKEFIVKYEDSEDEYMQSFPTREEAEEFAKELLDEPYSYIAIEEVRN